MTTPELTYELKLISHGQPMKEHLIQWLLSQGQESFVEETCDDLYLDDPSDKNTFSWDQYLESTGKRSLGLSFYSYDEQSLLDLADQAQKQFPGLKIQILSSQTKDWLDGWKDHFHPIQTEDFLIYPPWAKLSEEDQNKKYKIVIEPGMAFGTGQHETTQLCLEALSCVPESALSKVLDVGTGTGILAIGALKLGAQDVSICDIDPDAILAAQENAKLNDLKYKEFWKGSLPHPYPGTTFNLVFANILAPVILSMMGEFEKILHPGSWIIFSGILTEQVPQILEQATDIGLVLEKRFVEKDWEALLMQLKK